MARFLFPRWSNKVLPFTIFFVLGPMSTAAVAGIWYYVTNKHLEVGYQPHQPIPYSHKLHAGDMGMDCRYCHFTVERSYFSAIPPTETCMNCHWKVKTDSVKLLPLRESYATDKPIQWIRVHNLPDFVYFDHSAHLASGVGCSSCHGRIDQMPEVRQDKPLSMGWCLDCHRDPGKNLRESKDITNMNWPHSRDWQGGEDPDADKLAMEGGVKPDADGKLKNRTNGRVIAPPTHCSGCHR